MSTPAEQNRTIAAHLAAITVAVAVFAGGCAFSHQETARQIDDGEFVTSGSLRLPAYIFTPRFNANAMYGIAGRADVSAHAGVTLGTANAGIGARVYLGDRFTFSLQTDASRFFEPFDSDLVGGEDRAILGMLTVTPRLSTAVKGDEMFYGGLHTPMLGVLRRTPGGGSETIVEGALLGGFVGIDHLFDGGNWGFQTELSLLPAVVDPEEGLTVADEFPYAYAEFSAGVYHRW